MPPVDQPGLYKGVITDCGVSTTRKAKLPQFVVTLLATERHSDVDDTWVEWAEYEQVIIGYFTLVFLDAQGQVAKCLNYEQIMRAVGWDGETYSGLAAMDLKGKPVQFRVVEDTYQGKVTFKVNWIDAEDAQIGLRKLSGQDLTDLDAQFRASTGKKATPKSVSKGKAKAETKVETKVKTKAAPKPPKATPKKAPEVKPDAVETCTETQAYEACLAANAATEKPMPEEVLDDAWVTRTDDIAADVENVTDEEWVKIRDAVLTDVTIPF